MVAQELAKRPTHSLRTMNLPEQPHHRALPLQFAERLAAHWPTRLNRAADWTTSAAEGAGCASLDTNI
jgi:hypothetical protein